MSAPLLALRGAEKSYGSGPRAARVLHGIDLEVRAGSSLGIVGESGAGKSTILNLLMGLSSPTAGTVEFRGEPLRRARPGRMRDFRRAVQLVFQDPRSSLDPRMSVGRILREPLESLRIPGDHGARVAELLESVGLEPGMASRYPGEFSGGQRQRIAIARALAPSPEVLVADEPVSALDVSVRAQTIALLARLKEELGMTMVIVSHDIAIVGQLCEQIVILSDGRIVEHGPTPEVLTDPRDPYTRRLLAAVPQLG
ncbi:ABC transporter ATP-binding protein [Brachybacterium hainanense]|uniref:ABC transporter ATP-binding protein n=1 Tax=Brachybacterium hainanense TaxID=1541174 RepID=A0ABV6RD69_9MICO